MNIIRPLTTAVAVCALLGACASSADRTKTAAPEATTVGAGSAAVSDLAPTDGFPVTIEHKYGSVTIDERPTKVVSIGFGEHDNLLALGVTPIAVRDWYGEQPYGTWPWAQDELGDATPVVLPSAELNFEQIAALAPDIIIGIASGMTDADYATLSAIAPTVAQPADYIDYGTPWDVALEVMGRALGIADTANTLISDTKKLFADTRAAHPEFDGVTAAVTFYFDKQPGAYASGDARSRLLTDLGFVIPSAIDDAAGDAFFVSFSPEDLSLIDTDAVIWIVGDATATAGVRDLPTRRSTRAFREGRELHTDQLLSGAFSHAGPLAFEYVLDNLVPELVLAVDGDPATAVPSAAAIGTGNDQATDASATSDATTTSDADAAATFITAYDSSVSFADKSALIIGSQTIKDTIDSYADWGAGLGGISLEPTLVQVDGAVATITYDILFGGQPAYSDQQASVINVDGEWVVETKAFCNFMAVARTPVPCPAS